MAQFYTLTWKRLEEAPGAEVQAMGHMLCNLDYYCTLSSCQVFSGGDPGAQCLLPLAKVVLVARLFCHFFSVQKADLGQDRGNPFSTAPCQLYPKQVNKGSTRRSFIITFEMLWNSALNRNMPGAEKQLGAPFYMTSGLSSITDTCKNIHYKDSLVQEESIVEIISFQARVLYSCGYLSRKSKRITVQILSCLM